jgi:hypothetical protein
MTHVPGLPAALTLSVIEGVSQLLESVQLQRPALLLGGVSNSFRYGCTETEPERLAWYVTSWLGFV